MQSKVAAKMSPQLKWKESIGKNEMKRSKVTSCTLFHLKEETLAWKMWQFSRKKNEVEVPFTTIIICIKFQQEKLEKLIPVCFNFLNKEVKNPNKIVI